MIEFKVGDTLSVCAAVNEFCGQSFQQYSMGSIDISKYPDTCTVTTAYCLSYPPCCLPLSGLTVSFEFTNYSTTIIKTLGTRTTDANGIASMNYILTQEDADLFNNNPGFRVRAYLVGSGPNYPSETSSSRYKTTSDLLIRGAYTGNACIQRPMSICINDKTLIVYENPAYVSGTITSVCVYRSGSSAILPEAKIKVFRLTNTTWSVVGESGYQQLQNDGITIFSTSIVVQKGDYIGLYVRPSAYSACIFSNSYTGLYYTKTISGDILANTDDSLLTSEMYYGVSISATIIPCTGVICPDICGGTLGFDLYHQTCINGICTPDAIPWQPNSITCGYVPPQVNKYELYFKVPDIYPAWYVDSMLTPMYDIVTNLILTLTSYFVRSVVFDRDTYIVTVTIESYPTASLEIISLGPDGKPEIKTMVAPALAALFVYALAVVFISMIATLIYLVFFGKKETVAGQVPSTRAITVNANICTPDATTGQLNCNPLTDPNMVVEVKYNIGKEQTVKEITKDSPTITFSAPTNVDVVITANIKNNPYYSTYTETIKSCAPGETCPTTIPITVKLKPIADATANPKVTDTTGNPLAGKYKLFIQSSEGIMVEDGSGVLSTDGSIPATKIPANKPYCALIYPSDYPTHDIIMKCYTPGAGETSDPTIISKTCQEEKNKVSVRTVYISSDGSRLAFTANKIEIMYAGSPVRTMTKDDPVEANRITSDITVIDGLEKNKTYTVHVTPPTGYAIISGNQDQQVSYTTDCQTTIMLIVEANPPSGTYDITIQVQNSVTYTPLQGANVTLGNLPSKKTDVNGSAIFTAVPQGTGYDLKIVLTGYKDNTSKIDITTSTTITKYLEVDQVLATIDTRISSFLTVGDVIATKSVKFKGTLEYLDGTTYRPLIDAPITVTVKDKDNNALQTLSAMTSSGVLGTTIGAGNFETGEWLIPANLVNTQISSTATFEGAGKYKSSTVTTTYAVAKAEACAIPIPFTNSCLLSKETGTALLLIGGVLVGGYILFKVLPAGKAAVTEVRLAAAEKIAPSEKELIKLEQRKAVTGAAT